jgi:RNA polymerase sigma-70 factor (ECF subfamily)
MGFMRTVTEHTPRRQAMDHERLLIERAQSGDRQAFEELIIKYDADILRLTIRLLGNPDEARDAYQEAFLKVFCSICQFRQQSSFYTWIFRIATNVCFDRLRQRKKPWQQVSIDSETRDGFRGALKQTVRATSCYSNPEQSFRATQLRERINQALSTLSQKERLVFELKHYEGLRLKQIGEMIGSTENTTKDCLYRATRKLRASLTLDSFV